MKTIIICNNVESLYLQNTITNLLKFCCKNLDKHAKIVGKWIRLKCPFAKFKHQHGKDDHPSFGIYLDFPHGYNCFSCGSKGIRIKDLLNELGYNGEFNSSDNFFNFCLPSYVENVDNVKKMCYNKMLAHFVPCPNHPYLIERGIDFYIAKELQVCYDEIANRLCFPVFDCTNCCTGIQGRSLGSNLPKYKFYTINNTMNTGLLYGEQWVNFDDPLVIVEGVFDVAKVKPHWYNVCTFFGVNPSKKVIQKLFFAKKVLMLFDNDKAGYLACNILQSMLPLTQCINIQQNLGYKDPGEMPTEVVRWVVSKHVRGLK